MNKDTYTPRNNGTQGLEEFGEDGNAFEDGTGLLVAVAVPPVGPTYEPALVRAYLSKGGRITKGPTRWAHGALRFSLGWDERASTANAQTSVYVDEHGDYHEHVGYCGRDLGSMDGDE